MKHIQYGMDVFLDEIKEETSFSDAVKRDQGGKMHIYIFMHM